MESPTDLVRRFCAAWSDNVSTVELMAYFADDAVYHNVPLAPIMGKEAIATNIDSFIRPGPPGIEAIDFRLVHVAANGPVVMTERVDVFTILAGRSSCPSWAPLRSVTAKSTPGATISIRTNSPPDRDRARRTHYPN